jgi:hypothetical protein
MDTLRWVTLPTVGEGWTLYLRPWTKIEQQSYLQDTSSQVIEGLCLVTRLKRSGSLEFDQNRPVHEEVHPEISDYLAPKYCLESKLLVDRQSLSSKSNGHGFAIDRFEKAGAEFVVNLKEYPDDPSGQFFIFESAFISVRGPASAGVLRLLFLACRKIALLTECHSTG